MTYLEDLKKTLRPYVVYQNRPELLSWLPKEILMIDEEEPAENGELKLNQGSFYLTESRKLPKISVENASILILCAASDKDGERMVKKLPEELCFIVLSCSLTKAYNLLNTATRQEEKEILDFSDIWKQIENKSLRTSEQIDTTLKHLSQKIYDFKRLGVITFKNPYYIPLTTIVYRIKPFFEDALIARTNGKILILLSSQERNFQYKLKPQDRETLTSILKEYDGILAISNATRKSDGLNNIFLLTERTADIMREVRFHNTDFIFDMEYYSSYTSIQLAMNGLLEEDSDADPLLLAHPAVVTLTRYDREHHDRLRDTCFYYLTNERNLQKTADATFMHRNTIINKVKKIKEIIDIDWEDSTVRQRLIFSCQLLRYYENVMHRTFE